MLRSAFEIFVGIFLCGTLLAAAFVAFAPIILIGAALSGR